MALIERYYDGDTEDKLLMNPLINFSKQRIRSVIQNTRASWWHCGDDIFTNGRILPPHYLTILLAGLSMRQCSAPDHSSAGTQGDVTGHGPP